MRAPSPSPVISDQAHRSAIDVERAERVTQAALDVTLENRSWLEAKPADIEFHSHFPVCVPVIPCSQQPRLREGSSGNRHIGCAVTSSDN